MLDDLPAIGIHPPDQPGPGGEPLGQLRLDPARPVARRDDLDDQVGGEGDMLLEVGDPGHPLLADEGNVGAADGVGVPLGQEAGLGREHPAEAVRLDVHVRAGHSAR